MNSFNEEVCEYNSTSVTENFKNCPIGMHNTSINECPTRCGKWVGFNKLHDKPWICENI